LPSSSSAGLVGFILDDRDRFDLHARAARTLFKKSYKAICERGTR
jgi:hypothetical protein